MGLWKYLSCGLRGRGRTGTSAVSSASAVEVQRMEARTWAALPIAAPEPLSNSVPALIEALEPRLQLTATFDCFMSAAVSGRTVTVVLWNTGAQASQFTVNWNDPNGSGSLNYTANADGSPLTKFYTYMGTGTLKTTITASAKTSAGATSTTAYYALGGAFGNFQGVQGTGASTRIPNANTGTVGQTAMAIDNTIDHFSGELFVAHTYYPSGGGGPLIGITAFKAPGQSGAGQFDSTWGNYNGSANNGTYVVPSFGGGSDVPYGIAVGFGNSRGLVIVVGKCALGWAIVAVDTSQDTNTHNYGVAGWEAPSGTTAFEAGQANAIFVGDFVEVAGTNGTKMVAAALNIDGTIPSGWGDSSSPGIVTVPFKTPGVDFSETGTAVFEEDQVFGGRLDENMVVGGYTTWCCCTGNGTDFTLVEINDDTGVYGATIRTNIGNTIPCCSNSTDKLWALIPWLPPAQGSDPEVTAVGQTTATGSTTVGLAQYDLVTNALVSTFGHHGVATGPAGTGRSGALLDSSTGDFVVTGDANGDIMTERYTSAGALDTAAGSTFGNAGIMYQDFGDLSSNSNDIGWSVLMGADGSVLVGGSMLPNGSNNRQIALADYFANNQLTIT